MITIKGLRFSYRPDDPLFDGISFDLSMPGFYAIFGRSGSGKSTLGKIFARRLSAAADVISVPEPVLYASTDDILPHWVPVAKHLNEFLPPNTNDKLTSYWEAAQLDKKTYASLPPELSLGQRQRVNLARYVVREAPCLVLDEVLVGVDQPSRWRILKWIKGRRQGLFTILISHEIDDVAVFSKQVIKLESSRPASISVLTGCDLDEVPDVPSTTHIALRKELVA
ncbi:MAG TPA: ATP-binding cassette domain-containing protein [Xanthobacteraceae bacterium]|nr:ATP-binding cassette domain-containing protein [Xanthobacteraceae bacterium]